MPREAITGQDSVKKLAHAVFASSNRTSRHTLNAQMQTPAATDSTRNITGYTIVIASHVTRRNAQAYTSDLHRRGYDQANVYTRAGRTKVIYGHYATREEALRVLNRLTNIDEFNSCWITRLK